MVYVTSSFMPLFPTPANIAVRVVSTLFGNGINNAILLVTVVDETTLDVTFQSPVLNYPLLLVPGNWDIILGVNHFAVVSVVQLDTVTVELTTATPLGPGNYDIQVRAR